MKRFCTLCVIFAATIAALEVSARIINIPDDYSTIQAGIDASVEGDTVLVWPGRYIENLEITGRSITLASRFLTTGDTAFISQTTIDGDSSGSVVWMDNNSSVKIVGFMIANGRGHYGAGIYCDSTGEAIIANNKITNNTAIGPTDGFGGGIFCLDSEVTIANNAIENNWSFIGGGIYCTGVSAVIKGNMIRGNVAEFSGEHGGYGGGLYLERSNTLISNNVIIYDSSFWGGGGIHAYGETMTSIANSIICFNNPFGLSIYDSSATVSNCILWGNVEGQIYHFPPSPNLTYSDIQGGFQGDGNIDTDPLFRNPTAWDFHLMSTQCGDPSDSPCIDAGHPDSLDEELNCLAGLGRARSDMGAFGGRGNITSIEDEAPIKIPITCSLSQNYPNPFNPSTTIMFDLPRACHVRIEIFDILGRRVAMLLDERRLAGHHELIWNSGEFSSGIYFYRVTAGDFVDVKKMTLLR